MTAGKYYKGRQNGKKCFLSHVIPDILHGRLVFVNVCFAGRRDGVRAVQPIGRAAFVRGRAHRIARGFLAPLFVCDFSTRMRSDGYGRTRGYYAECCLWNV
jgi:hypothetical protein